MNSGISGSKISIIDATDYYGCDERLEFEFFGSWCRRRSCSESSKHPGQALSCFLIAAPKQRAISLYIECKSLVSSRGGRNFGFAYHRIPGGFSDRRPWNSDPKKFGKRRFHHLAGVYHPPVVINSWTEVSPIFSKN